MRGTGVILMIACGVGAFCAGVGVTSYYSEKGLIGQWLSQSSSSVSGGGMEQKPLARASLFSSLSVEGAGNDIVYLTRYPSSHCGGPMLLDGVGDDVTHQAHCLIDHMSLGKQEIDLAGYRLDVGSDSYVQSLYDVQLEIQKLDPQNAIPQIFVSGYTGGAHCCAVTSIFWHDALQGWRHMTLPERNGGGAPPVLRVPHAVPVLAFPDESFLYAYTSYAGSVTPLVLQRFHDGTLENVTRDPLYRPVLLRNLCQDIQERQAYEPNGFLAYYVATLATLGHFREAWAYMLQHQAKPHDNGFSHDLREHLLKERYITQEEHDAAPLKGEALSQEERRRLAPQDSLFVMLPQDEQNALAAPACHTSASNAASGG